MTGDSQREVHLGPSKTREAVYLRILRRQLLCFVFEVCVRHGGFQPRLCTHLRLLSPAILLHVGWF